MAWRTALGGTLAAAVALATLTACGGGSDSAQCRDLASETLTTTDTQFTEVTGVDNAGTVLGYVGQYRGGETERVLFWHCEMQDGEPAITWTSTAAP